MRNFLCFLLFLSYSVNCSSQHLGLDSIFGNNKAFILEVKQLDQFIKRFNNRENVFTGEEKTKSQIQKEKENLVNLQTERKKNIISLLNFEDSMLIGDKKTVDFIEYTGNDSNKIEISYFDENWFAKVNCSVKYKGKEQNIFLTLKKDGDKKKGFKWILLGINTPFINLVPRHNDDSTKFIGPMNHELGFMGLSEVFNDYTNISEYSSKVYVPDDLSVFFFLVKTKEIQYVKVNSIQYHFLQIPDWIFTVDYYNRPSNNSGWLISSLTKTSDAEKINYRKSILYINQ